jgi:gamma-glutamylcyclotransferase (GGCT)/AIG2-like uncharacterized protein YtfP
VYGTLKRGGESHGLLERLGASYVGKGSVAGELFDLGAFPGAVKSEAQPSRVLGEIYRLHRAPQALGALDEYEGVRPKSVATRLYRREIAEVRLENGDRVSAWIYWLNHVFRRGRRIESGDYAPKRPN